MTLPPGRFDYAPINDRPIIRWPDNARVAFWVAPNMEFFEYLPENRPAQPDIPHYARMDYGNRVGFWRMLDVLNKHKLRACCCLNLEILDHFPEIKDAMVAADWDYMAHGLYNSLDFPPWSGGVRSERHAAARMVIPSMLARASAGVR